MTTPAPFFTPPEVAKILRVKPDRVIGWIRAGKLQGIDLAQPGSRRPRYRVSEQALADYVQSLAVTPPKQPTRQRAKLAGITRFF